MSDSDFGKPSEKEEEYFARREFARRREEAQKRAEAQAVEERQRQKDLHYMRCPKCGSELLEIDYKDLKIDKCTGCDGVWLDPGEMDRLIEAEQKNMPRLLRLFR